MPTGTFRLIPLFDASFRLFLPISTRRFIYIYIYTQIDILFPRRSSRQRGLINSQSRVESHKAESRRVKESRLRLSPGHFEFKRYFERQSGLPLFFRRLCFQPAARTWLHPPPPPLPLFLLPPHLCVLIRRVPLARRSNRCCLVKAASFKAAKNRS